VTLTLHQNILHTIVHHSSTSTYIQATCQMSLKSKKHIVDEQMYI